VVNPALTLIGLTLADPVAQREVVETEFVRDLRDRPSGGHHQSAASR
jgi:hypothetical protein